MGSQNLGPARASGDVDELAPRVEELASRIRARSATSEPLIESAPVAVCAHSAGSFLYANPACARLHGLERPEDMLGRNVLDFVCEADQSTGIDRLWKQHEGTRHVVRWRFTGRRADGAGIPLSVHSTVIEGEGGRVTIALAVPMGPPEHDSACSHDIPHQDLRRRLATLELLEWLSHEVNDLILEALPVPVFVHDAGRVLYVNPLGRRLIAADEDVDLVGGSLMDYVTETDVMARRAMVHKGGGELDPWFAYELHRLDGSTVRIKGHTGPLSAEPAGPLFSVVLEARQL